MATFRVRLTRDQTESLDVFVEAESKDKAFEAAVEKAGRYGELANGWELNEGNPAEVYLGDNEGDIQKLTDRAELGNY
jgi:hypothetical protein